MSTLFTRMFARPRGFGPTCASCQEGQGKRCACREATKHLRREPTPSRFWFAYALLLVAGAAVLRALV